MGMKMTIIVVICLLVVTFLGWTYERGQQTAKDETCRQIRYRLDCNTAWQEYRLHPSPGNKPICDTGELSLREVTELINSEIGLGCPAR
jgi:hypothetical protein